MRGRIETEIPTLCRDSMPGSAVGCESRQESRQSVGIRATMRGEKRNPATFPAELARSVTGRPPEYVALAADLKENGCIKNEDIRNILRVSVR